MSNAEATQSSREGQVVTFYSFKGGTGRTMALANVAWILAANGMRVLVADWDLESPGLHRFFQPFMDAGVAERPGIVDFVRRYEWAAVDAGIDPEALEVGSEDSKKAAHDVVASLIDEYVGQLTDYTIPLAGEFSAGGALHFLSSGKQTNGAYQSALSALDWDTFYENLFGGQFFDALRAFMKRTYDYVLIDSRTGLSDVADICTVHLPDTVVDCFTLSTQAIEGAAMIAQMIKAHSVRHPITILPIPMRIDHTQKEKVGDSLTFAARKFVGLPAGMSEEQRIEYWAAVEVPYRHVYAYEEILAVFGDQPGLPASLLSSYERLAARITGGAVTTLPPREEWLRLRDRTRFSRTESSSPFVVVLDFSPEDQLWAEWISAVLASGDIRVRWVGEPPASWDDPAVATQAVAIVTEYYMARMAETPGQAVPDLLISVTEERVPANLADVPVIFLSGLSESQATDRLIDRLGGRRPMDSDAGVVALRYPGGNRPQIVSIPARNANFTGRDSDLGTLRDELRASQVAVVLPLTIQGLGGVGKTQIALEYGHRFKAYYDVIWWMNCGQLQYVDASLADLGQRLREVFGASLPEEGGVAEIAQQVLQLLSDGLKDKRWLLIYDNAEDNDELRNLLPAHPGHVLITSREEGWTNLGKSLKVDNFKPEESISHLRRRTPRISGAEAARVAEVLRNMPLAVAAAGALLATTDMPVSEYLRQLERQAARTFPPGDPLNDYPEAVAKAWDLSLDQLQRTSPAATRLLELCSVMAPDISLDLINSQAMADALRELDASISERAMIARLIKQIDRLALIKLDNNAHQIQVHRVVQAVVNQRMSEEERETARRGVHTLVVAARPDGDVEDPQTWARFRLIWPHLTPSRAMYSTETPVRQLLIERVRYLRLRDDLERGIRRAEEIEKAWMGMLADRPEPEMAESLQRQLFRLRFNLANIRRDLAQFQEARALDEAVLAGQRERLGELHPHTLQTRSSLAADLRALGDYRAALDLDIETYRAWNSEYGDEYRGSLSAAHNLALSFLLTGDFRRALAQDRQTLERRAVGLGPTNPRTLNSGAAIARDLLEAGRYQEAVGRIKSVWDQSRDALRDDDRATLNARLWLGIALRCAGSPDQAAAHFDAAMNGLIRGFGRDSTDALASRLSYALNLMAAGHISQAKDAAEGVLAVYEKRVGITHPYSLICRLNISTILCLEKNYLAAEIMVRQVAEGLQERLGEAHPYTLDANMVLAAVLANQGQLAEARVLEELVMARRSDWLGPQHPDTLRCRVNLLLTQQELGVDGASAGRDAVLDELRTLIGPDHPDVATAIRGERLLCAIDPQPF